MTPESPVERVAREVAERAHHGQVDKAGEPYIGHVARVVARLDDPLDRAVGWLHDVLEDAEWTVTALLAESTKLPYVTIGMYEDWQSAVLDAKCLTHRPNEPRDDYYARIRTSPRAVRVKLADIADNTDPARLAVLDEDTRDRLTVKYEKAKKVLEVSR